MTYYVAGIPYSPNDIYHHGIKGQKWGVRRYTNPDGTLTEEGKRRYGTIENFNRAQEQRRQRIDDSRWASAARGNELLNDRQAVKRKAAISAAVMIGGSLVATGAMAGLMRKAKVDPQKAAKYASTATNALVKLGILGTAVNAARDIHNAKQVERRDKTEAFKKSRTSQSKSSNGSSSLNRYSNNRNTANVKVSGSKFKTVAKVGAGLAVAGAAVYGAKKLNDIVTKGNNDYLNALQGERLSKLFESAQKDAKKNKIDYYLGRKTSQQRDRETKRINDMLDYMRKAYDQDFERQKHSSFINKASNAISYYNKARKKK